MNYIKIALLMATLIAILVFVGHLFDQKYGGNFFSILFLFIGLGINFISYWYSDKIVLGIYRAQPVRESEMPELYDMIRRLSEHAGIPMPKIYITPMNLPNAFATGRNPSHAAVCVTSGLLDMLSQREIEGVLAHELSHVKHNDTLIMSICAAIAGMISLLGRLAFYSSLFGDRRRNSNALGQIFLIIIAPFLALMIQLAISRSREYKADEGGGRLSGDPDALADALLRLEDAAKHARMQPIPATSHLFIVNPAVGGGSLLNIFSTHPPTTKRVARLREMAHRLDNSN
jgi:heat shock protein HtpX